MSDDHSSGQGGSSWSPARQHASAGEWAKALNYVNALLPGNRLKGVPAHIGSAQLAFSIYLNTGHLADAGQTLEATRKHYGLCPDWHLMQCSLNQSMETDDDGVATLRQLYKRHKLALPGYRHYSQALSLDNLLTRSFVAHGLQHQPLVSVILSVFNAQATLGTALQSLMEQSWQHLEMIVVDDGSTDKTFELAHSLAEQDSRIRVL